MRLALYNPAMCLIAVALGTRPGLPLLFLGNRDEYYERPSEQAHWWRDHPEILGGRDRRAGGSWLAIRRDGHLAVVTNYRDPSHRYTGNRSRGELVLNYLAERLAPADYAQRLEAMRGEYAGYSLLFGQAQELWYFSNRGGPPQRLDAGIHGLSNHLLNSRWPKVEALRQRLAGLSRGTPERDALFDSLRDTALAEDENLPDTGVSLERERALSPAFVRLGDYGTRSSTLISVAGDGQIQFEERNFGPAGEQVSARRFDFMRDTSEALAVRVHS